MIFMIMMIKGAPRGRQSQIARGNSTPCGANKHFPSVGANAVHGQSLAMYVNCIHFGSV